MASVEPRVTSVGHGAGRAPSLPSKPTLGRRRIIAYLAGVAVLALCIYSWINVQGSVGALVTGFFDKKGLLRDFIPHSPPRT